MSIFGIAVTPIPLVIGLVVLVIGAAVTDFIWCAIKAPRKLGIRLIIYGVLLSIAGGYVNWIAAVLALIAFAGIFFGILILTKKGSSK